MYIERGVHYTKHSHFERRIHCKNKSKMNKKREGLMHNRLKLVLHVQNLHEVQRQQYTLYFLDNDREEEEKSNILELVQDICSTAAKRSFSMFGFCII